jgi:hypothetical protein
MTAREVIETAVNVLEDQLTKTRHIARFSDLNKIRKEHLRELRGALMSSEVPGYPVPWSGLVGYQLNLARVIISEHKRSSKPIRPV